MNPARHRARLLDWVRSQLIGPAASASPGSSLPGAPLERYPCAILFPVVRGELDLFQDDGDDDETGEDAARMTDAHKEPDQQAEPVKRLRRYVPPSAAGFSFFIRGAEIRLQLRVSAAAYRLEGERDERGLFLSERWLREPLACTPEEEDRLVLAQPDDRTGPANRRIPVFSGRAGVDAVWRPFRDGWLVTLSLFNRTELQDDGLTAADWKRHSNSNSLFEASLHCSIDAGEVGDYPRVDRSLLSDEERELELQYRSRRIFAIGHGCAADWTTTSTGGVREIRTDFLPSVEVPAVTANLPERDDDVLDLDELAGIGRDARRTSQLTGRLRTFVDGYAAWIAARQGEARGLDDTEAARRIVGRMDAAMQRMRRGVELLESDTPAARAFALANRAMALQMRQAAMAEGKAEPRPLWRPFQLAFLLATIEPMTNEDSPERDLVDLIWFPTGGGKTEAYLGLIAFLVGWRRQRFPDSGGGTTAIMRYTLRLLTAQQFQRASRLICALEWIRRSDPTAGLGTEPVTLGMWVGSDATPNMCSVADARLRDSARLGAPPPPELVLTACPWCGTEFRPGHNYRTTPTSFRFLCTNPHCDIATSGDGVVPCQVIDEALYDAPPTLLIATIDKFARLAWEERAGAFFGRNGTRPPELVIQDELHLISGALGSIAGLYEAALDTVLVRRGVRPKYVASTATIRMAAEQVERLYGRKLAVFPPPGLDCDDSYFARTEPTGSMPGRLYVGYFAPLLDRQHCLAPLAATLLAAPEAVFGPDDPDRDAILDHWWTTVVYHGSLKGVGTSHNAFDTDVGRILHRLSDERSEALRDGRPAAGTGTIQRPRPRVDQLTSNASAAGNARTFDRLRHPRGHPDCLDAVLATNMVSVGLDVERLALMIVNGQPLTTGEYIQSTSRVGRGRVPGLVFANYYRDQARSLSHFENFRPYHESFYRFVEPTSVTPYTRQARSRALHAALVSVVRHAVDGMAGKQAAGRFDQGDPAIRTAVAALAGRCVAACGTSARDADLREHLGQLAAAWHDRARACAAAKQVLVYNDRPDTRNSDRLLHSHGDPVPGLWETMQSMRNVEETGLLKRP